MVRALPARRCAPRAWLRAAALSGSLWAGAAHAQPSDAGAANADAGRPSVTAPGADASTPTANARAANARAANAPTADAPTADAPTANAPTANAPTADAPTAETPTADAPTSDAAAESSWRRAVDVNGYATARGTFSRSRFDGLVPTDSQPQWQGFVELNTQLKVTYWGRSFVYTDTSALLQLAGDFRDVGKDGAELILPPRDTPQGRPFLSVNELYVLHEFIPQLNLTVGKKRIVWGPGFAYNPTDLINVRKDPTDPTFQRAGAWLAQVEAPFEKFTLTFLFAPAVLKEAFGLPAQFLTWPSWDYRDGQAHYQLAARVYALIAQTDLNLMFFYGNAYGDAFEKKPRVAASFSRIFFDRVELHGELLLQTGSARSYVEPGCVSSTTAALACALSGTAPLTTRELQSPFLTPTFLLGGRYDFADDSILSLEYLYQGDGYTRPEYQALVNALDLVQPARAAGVDLSRIPGASALLGGSTDGLPQRFRFQPTTRHYLFASFSKPRIRDDFTAAVTVIANLTDLSTLVTPSVTWSVTQAFQLAALGFFPIPGPDALAADRLSTGGKVSEYGAVPFIYRFVLEAKLFY